MAAIICIAFTGVLLWGAFRFLTSGSFRKDVQAGWKKEATESPWGVAFVVVWMACILVFFWGVMIPPFGEIATPLAKLRVWQVAGIGAGLGFVLFMLVGSRLMGER
jgi:ABC-type Fe3+ transport system permease subunit